MRSIIPVSDKPHLHKSGGQWMCFGLVKTWLSNRIVTMWGKTPQEAYLRYKGLTSGD